MHSARPPPPHAHNRELQRELTLHRNQHEINTFYVALKALIDLWIHLLCLRKVSLAFFPLTIVTGKRFRVSSDILVIFGTQCPKTTRQSLEQLRCDSHHSGDLMGGRDLQLSFIDSHL